MRTIGVVTGSRADYGIYVPVLRAIEAAPDLRLRLMVCGTHFAREFGHTADVIEADGFTIDDRIETLMASDTPEGIAKSMANGVAGFAQAFARETPDILLLLGDRTEMLAAAVAALPFVIPMAHIHGGESTEGLVDEAVRHSLTKMSHIHFAATEAYARRIIQMGEDPARVHVSGAPSLDNLHGLDFLSDAELAERTGLPMNEPPVLVTFHPVTLEYGEALAQQQALLAAMEDLPQPMVFTYPNGDTNSRLLISALEEFVAPRPNAVAVRNLGTRAYFSLLRRAAAMVGNSSSGIIEAASFGVPVLNIGNRQRGRLHGINVVDVAGDTESIRRGLARILEPEFARSVRGMANPYGDGTAAARIVEVLRHCLLDRALMEKRFHDLPGGAA
jgi:UDP-hydrolysing UDP-N-acetyl-D-glucosamine 2-epimerase